VITDFCRNGF